MAEPSASERDEPLPATTSRGLSRTNATAPTAAVT